MSQFQCHAIDKMDEVQFRRTDSLDGARAFASEVNPGREDVEVTEVDDTGRMVATWMLHWRKTQGGWKKEFSASKT